MVSKFDFLKFYCTQLSPETVEHLPCKFNPGIDQAQINQLEQQAEITVPDELKEFYEFSYGVRLSEYQILTIPESDNSEETT
jgi:cell wall assembly regulator SMI1